MKKALLAIALLAAAPAHAQVIGAQVLHGPGWIAICTNTFCKVIIFHREHSHGSHGG